MFSRFLLKSVVRSKFAGDLLSKASVVGQNRVKLGATRENERDFALGSLCVSWMKLLRTSARKWPMLINVSHMEAVLLASLVIHCCFPDPHVKWLSCRVTARNCKESVSFHLNFLTCWYQA